VTARTAAPRLERQETQADLLPVHFLQEDTTTEKMPKTMPADGEEVSWLQSFLKPLDRLLPSLEGQTEKTASHFLSLPKTEWTEHTTNCSHHSTCSLQ